MATPLPRPVTHPGPQALAAQRLAAQHQIQQNGGQPPVPQPPPQQQPAPRPQRPPEPQSAARQQPNPSSHHASPIDVAIKAGPAALGFLVGKGMDTVFGIIPGLPKDSRYQFAARPEDLGKGALIGAGIVGTALTAGAVLGVGGGAAAAGPAVATTIGRTGGGAAGFATAQGAGTVGAGAGTALAAGAAATLPLAVAEIFPTTPNPGPQFPTGRPEQEIFGGKEPFDIGTHRPGNSEWSPGGAEIGNGPNISRATITPPKNPAGTNERIARDHHIPEIPYSPDAWNIGRAEIFTRPDTTKARFQATEAIPSPQSPFGPSNFPDAFPAFPTGPQPLSRPTAEDRLVQPTVPVVTPDIIAESPRYVFVTPPETQVKPGNTTSYRPSDRVADALDGGIDAALPGAFAHSSPLDYAHSPSVPITSSILAALATPASAASTIIGTDTIPEINILDNPFDFPPENPPGYPPANPPAFSFGPPAQSQERRRRKKSKKKSKKKSTKKGGIGFFELSPVPFAIVPPPVKTPAKKKKKRSKK
ncbi:hypothetical protein J2129_002761 [Methanofollis sp. W23]|uniref:hypothetical protein n=1 Tax=Methanofollis sp. W23 TaxID=2817849 RepID=UPI001AEB00D6|nr:hypothetical protein [Methanofollis sp. W23]MBP2147248.1 hypothetical protein [Methanofollis sp. W23]